MLTMPSFQKSLIVEQFQGNYLKHCLYINYHRHLKNSGSSNPIGTHDFCDAGAMLDQLSHETTQLKAGQFVGKGRKGKESPELYLSV